MSECTITGWLWYCDVHDTHGNADSKAEAEVVSDAHVIFYDDTEGCEVVISEIKKEVK